MSIDDEIQDLKKANWLDIQQAGLKAVLQAQWSKLENETARLLLRVAGQLPEAAVLPAVRLGLLAGIEVFGRPGRPSALDRNLRQLEDASLVEKLQQEQVRLHPLVREFAKQQTPVEQKAAFRLSCAERLLSTYEQLPLLEQQCARRGIDALQEDLLAALDLTAGNPTPEMPARLQTLLRLLRREVHTLRGWQPGQQPTFFAQQIACRIQGLGLERLLPQVAGWLQNKTTHLRQRWSHKQESLALEYTLSGHSAGVWAVAITPDGKRAVSASYDGSLKVWELATGREEQTLSGHSDWVMAVAITPDGKRAVSASYDRTLKVWELATGREIVSISLDGPLFCVAVAPDGRTLVVGDGAGNVYCLELVL